MTRAQLAAHYRKTGLPACQISDPARQLFQIRFGPQNNEPTAEQLTDRLFKVLDTDKDGQLSRKELEAAPTVLASLDIDEDEMITTTELMGEAAGIGSVRPLPSSLVVGRGDRPPASNRCTSWPTRARIERWRRRWAHRYGKSGDESVTAAGAACPKNRLAVLDADRDGQLSLAELARFSDKPADVAVTVNLGNRSGKPLMALAEGKPLPAEAGQGNRRGRDAATRADPAGPARRPSPSQSIRIDLRDQYKTRFRRGPGRQRLSGPDDGAGARASSAASSTRWTATATARSPRKRCWPTSIKIKSFRKLVDKSCLSLTVANQGKGLFELLDADGDGRLSVRELRNAHKVLSTSGRR